MLLRFPTADRYVPQVGKEHRWLPFWAKHLDVDIPLPLEKGAPGNDYPWPWSVYRWVPGTSANHPAGQTSVSLAENAAAFLHALQRIPAESAPLAGAENFFRGGPVNHYDRETRECLSRLRTVLDVVPAVRIWEQALSAPYGGPPVWVHGDLTPANLLVRAGKLVGVIDFGQCAVGDPACDLTMAWTFFQGPAQAAFLAAAPADEAMWCRARGWALWKGLVQIRDAQTGSQSHMAAMATIFRLVEDKKTPGSCG